MIEKYFPDLIVDTIQDIDLEILKSRNIKGLILDIDNTLVPNKVKDADEKVVKWIENVKLTGIKTCIVSNAAEKRVIRFNQRLSIHAIHRAAKPSSRAFIKALRIMEIHSDEAAVIGDQLFTDIFGGNRLNMFTILVKPLDKKEQVFIKLKRIAEKYVMRRYNKKTDKHDSKKTNWKKDRTIKIF